MVRVHPLEQEVHHVAGPGTRETCAEHDHGKLGALEDPHLSLEQVEPELRRLPQVSALRYNVS